MTKIRKRKKAYDCALHYVGEDFLVTNGPYPIYNREHYCIAGKFNWTWGNHLDDELPCDKCKRFKVTRQMTRKQNMVIKQAKEAAHFYHAAEKAAKRLGITLDDYINKYM